MDCLGFIRAKENCILCILLFAEVNGVAGKLCLLLLVKGGGVMSFSGRRPITIIHFSITYKSGFALVQLRSGWV